MNVMEHHAKMMESVKTLMEHTFATVLELGIQETYVKLVNFPDICDIAKYFLLTAIICDTRSKVKVGVIHFV